MKHRNIELRYIFFALIIFILGISIVFNAKTASVFKEEIYFLCGLVAIILIMINLANRILAPWSNRALIPITAILCCLGILAIFRIDTSKAALQLLWIGVGITAMILTMLIFGDYTKLKAYKYLIGFCGLILMLSPIFFGVTRGGSKLWLNFGFMEFQPAEIAKVLLVLFFAAYLEEKKEVLSLKQKIAGLSLPPLKHLGPLILMWSFSLIILIFEKDLGSSLLFFGLFIVMLYLTTGRLGYVLSGLILFSIGALACYFAFSHVRVRVDVWLNPWVDTKGSGYQIIQSLFAIASGGAWGSGLGNGHPTNIPAVQTDFIFSSIAEEIGFFGAVAILLSYLLFIYQGFKTALETKENFGKLIAAGLSFIFGFQTFLIIGGATKLIPLTGVTLPFMSYGGSSIVANFIILGLLLLISSRTNQARAVSG